MPKYLFILLFAIFVIGCNNPVKRDPPNVFPGTNYYNKRVSTFKITPRQAYEIAYEKASADDQLHFISRKPTVVVKRSYVFSVPLASGANLQGYHVDGDSGKVKFFNEKKVVQHTK